MRLTSEKFVNGMVLAVCVVIGANATLQLIDRFRPRPAPPAPQASRSPQSYQAGDVLPELNGYSYSNADATLVLAVRSTCTYCTQSMPFYGRLIDAAKRSKGRVKIVAISTESTEVLQRYFESHSIGLETLRTVPDGYLQVTGTPTVLNVDSGGVVRDVWIGLLPPEREAVVLSKVSNVGGES